MSAGHHVAAATEKMEQALGVCFIAARWQAWTSPAFSGIKVDLTSDRPIQPIEPNDDFDIQVPGLLLADIATTGSQQLGLLLVNER